MNFVGFNDENRNLLFEEGGGGGGGGGAVERDRFL